MTDVNKTRELIANDSKLRALAGDEGVKAVLDLSDEKLVKLAGILKDARG